MALRPARREMSPPLMSGDPCSCLPLFCLPMFSKGLASQRSPYSDQETHADEESAQENGERCRHDCLSRFACDKVVDQAKRNHQYSKETIREDRSPAHRQPLTTQRNAVVMRTSILACSPKNSLQRILTDSFALQSDFFLHQSPSIRGLFDALRFRLNRWRRSHDFRCCA